MSRRSRAGEERFDYAQAERDERAYLASELLALCVASPQARQCAVELAAEDGVPINAVDLATAEPYLRRCLQRMSLLQLAGLAVETQDGAARLSASGTQRLAALWSAGAQGSRRWRLNRAGGASAAGSSAPRNGAG